MMAIVIFSGVAAALVYMAGRGDAARDPRLTGVALALLAGFPLWVMMLPKFAVLPAAPGGGEGAGFPWIGWIWAVGFGVTVLRLIIAAGVLARWCRESRWILSMGRIEVRELSHLKGPVAAGVFRRVVFVPEAWNDWPESTRTIVLDHETAHHDRHDPLRRWVAEIAAAVNWFNPLVWWMVRRFSVQCEFACDRRVLCKGVPAGEYAMLLCDLAEDSGIHGPAMAMAEHASLEVRIRRLMGPRASRRMVPISLMIGGALVSALVLAVIGTETGGLERVSIDEVRTRWAADPFPGEVDNGF